MKSEFRYQSWASDHNDNSLAFKFEHLTRTGERYEFVETLRFPVEVKTDGIGKVLCDMLHIALGLSYYKAFLPPEIKHPYALTEEEAAFWNEVLQNGMAEFVMRNKLPFTCLALFHAQSGSRASILERPSLREIPLLGFGGGKDSIVAGELLKQIGRPPITFVLASGRHTGKIEAAAAVMGSPEFTVERHIDHRILGLNTRSDVYNGHVPFSLFLALIGTLLAYSNNQAWFCVGNEASANIASATWNGKIVNHQWSKSFRFELIFNALLSRIHPELQYFSVIRPFTSVAIGRMLSRFQEYFPFFTSDSGSMRQEAVRRPVDRWPVESPKTLSTFFLLAPWLGEADLVTIFGRNLLDEQDLLPTVESLFGLSGERPMDCVGTAVELKACCAAVAQRPELSQKPLMKAALAKHPELSDPVSFPIVPHLAVRLDSCLPASISSQIKSAGLAFLQ